MLKALIASMLTLALCACAGHPDLSSVSAAQAKLCPAFPTPPAAAMEPSQEQFLDWLKSLGLTSSTTANAATSTGPN